MATTGSHVGPEEFAEQITLDNKPVVLQHARLDLGEVHLDPRNQRVQFLLSGRGGSADEAEITKVLWKREPTKELLRAIKANGGLIEPIIVRDGTVVEGNSRLVCYRKLREQNPDDARWQRIPARVLPEGITSQQVAILLGELHVAGKNEWTPFEQAAYVYRMHHELGYPQQFLAEHLRRSKSHINQLFRAYEMMKEKYLPKFPGPDSLEKFSYCLEYAKKVKPSTGSGVDRFVKWVGEGRISESAQVRELPEILASPKATEALDRGGFEVAKEVLQSERPELVSSLFATLGKATAALRTASMEELQDLRAGDAAKIRQVQEHCAALNEFLGMADLDLEVGVPTAGRVGKGKAGRG